VNVPRGTAPLTRPGAWRVVCLHLPRPWRIALQRGLKNELRVPLVRDNSTVHPGRFRGLDLESGRARYHGEVPELRARCAFASGNVRAVTVMPKFGRGDLLWVRSPRGARRRSSVTLEVIDVRVARLQDMTDANARAEGVGALPLRLRNSGTPRDWFAKFWEVRHGGRSWRRNPWVWVLRFRVHDENVDKLLERWRA
jgi:hypothetical protein